MSMRKNHLEWNGTEWVDDRCGCRYHPDDDNGTHGGAPHIHPCPVHGDQRQRLSFESGIRFVAPTGDSYQLSWDVTTKRVVLAMEGPGDPRSNTHALAITGRASNSIEITPRRRDQ